MEMSSASPILAALAQMRLQALARSRAQAQPGRERFVTWMFNDVQENEQSRMCSRAIVTFSTLFRADRNANLKKASDWFIGKCNIVGKKQTGKLMVHPDRQAHIDKTIVFHLGQVKRDFENGPVSEDFGENVDETHFVVNMDNGKTLGFRGDDSVKNTNVVSGGQGMTMIVHLSREVRASIEVLMLVFGNAKCACEIRGIRDDVPGIAYRTAKIGFVTRAVWNDWLNEERCQVTPLQESSTRTIFVDNLMGHDDIEASFTSLHRLNASLQ
uniref:Uncharacterized protein n=1 Tax=Physcomitrium patens TaxID=3218 RepID=A9RK68_PHYPA|nr:hypothetical protein PHYPA_009124 [Physcomitrium patens]